MLNTMETKRTKLYFVIFLLLCVISALLTYLFDLRLNEHHLPIPVMIIFTAPALCTVLSMLSTNGFKNFRLDAMGIVGSAIMIIAFEILTFALYFFIGKALSYAQYTNSNTAIVLGICSFIGVLPLIALRDTLRKNKLYIKEHGQQPGKFWRNLQYATLLTATLLTLFVFLPAEKNGGFVLMFIEFDTYSSSFWGIQILFLSLSMFLALVMFLVSWLWKQARAASVLSVILLVPFIGYATYAYLHETFGRFDGTQIFHHFTYAADRAKPEQKVDDDVVYVYIGGGEDDSSEDYEEEEEYGEPLSYAPQFIGDGIIGIPDSSDQEYGDLDSISAAVHYFARNMDLTHATIPYLFPGGLLPYLERSERNASRNEYGAAAYNGIITLLWNSRKGMAMDAMVDIYAHIIKEVMPYEKYRDNGYEQLVWELMRAYEDLKQNPSSFLEIYDLMMDKHILVGAINMYDTYVRYYEALKPYVSERVYNMIFPEYDKSGDDEEDYVIINAKCRAVWVYSFWGRRAHEKIQDTVYDGLCKLNEIYE